MPSRKWLLLIAKLAIVGLLLWGVHRTLAEAYDKLRDKQLHLEPLWLVAAGGLYLLAMVPSVLFWHRVLRVLGQEAGFFKTLRAYYIGHLGKYVPGKALVVVLRAGMVRGERVNVGVAAATVFVETLTMMASGSFIAAALVAILYHEHWIYVAGAILCMLAAGLPTLPPVFAYLARKARIGRGRESFSVGPEPLESPPVDAGLKKTPDPLDVDLRRIDYGTLLFGWLGTGVGWFVCGLSLWATLRAMGETSLSPIDDLPFLTMIVSISVVAGFISMIPGGLGSRDLIMLELLGLRLPASAAVVSTVLFRLVWLAAELVISAVLYPWRPKH
jgi:glycosyltransferase 2 family protein